MNIYGWERKGTSDLDHIHLLMNILVHPLIHWEGETMYGFVTFHLNYFMEKDRTIFKTHISPSCLFILFFLLFSLHVWSELRKIMMIFVVVWMSDILRNLSPLNTWSLIDGTVWIGLGSMTLSEKVRNWRQALRVQRFRPSQFVLCLLIVIKDVGYQLFCHACLCHVSQPWWWTLILLES